MPSRNWARKKRGLGVTRFPRFDSIMCAVRVRQELDVVTA